MVLSGVRALIARQISRIGRGRSRPSREPGPSILPTLAPRDRAVSPPPHPIPSVVEVAPSVMVYTYSAPFETGNLKVSDIHTLQSVSCPLPLSPHIFSCRVLVDEDDNDSYEVSGNRDGAPGAYRFLCAGRLAYERRRSLQSSSSMVRDEIPYTSVIPP